MRNIAKLAILPALLAFSVGAANASNGYNCEAKRAAIEYQIAQAKAHGNYHRVAGLEKALNDVNTYCSNSNLAVKAQQKVDKLEKKLIEKQSDVQSIQIELRQAQARGDLKKVAKYQKKIVEKQADVAKVQIELDAARAELAAFN